MRDKSKLLSTWMDRRQVKTAGAIQSIIQGLTKVPGYAVKATKAGAGLGIAGAAGESAIKTIHNAMQGNLAVGDPTWTANQLGSAANISLQGSGVGPAISGVTKSIVNGLDASPIVQQALQTGANITNPHVREQLVGDATRAMTDASGAIVQNVSRTAGGALGKSMADETANGIWSNLAQHPISTLTGAAAIGAGPAIAYDMATHKRRTEEAERNKAILRYITKNDKGVEKTGSIGDVVSRVAKSPAFSKYLYRPTGISNHYLSSLANKFKTPVLPDSSDPATLPESFFASHNVPISQINKHVNYPTTLFNNAATRNPGKTLLGSSVALGGATTAAQIFSSDNKYQDTTTGLGLGKRLLENTAKFPANLAATFEKKLINPEISPVKNSPTGSKLQTIINNLAGQGAAPDKPLDPSYRPPSLQMPDQSIDKLKHMDIMGGGPDINNPTSAPGANPLMKYLPYAGVAGLAGLPLPTYLAYKNYNEKKLRKTEATNERLQKKVETTNAQLE